MLLCDEASGYRIPPPEADARDQLANEAGVLPRAYVAHVVVSAREDEIVQRTAAALKPSEQRLTGRVNQLELHGPLGLLLDHDGAIPDPTTGNGVTDANPDHVAAAKLAVGGEVEKRPVAQSAMLVEPETDGANLLRFERTLGAKKSASIPGS